MNFGILMILMISWREFLGLTWRLNVLSRLIDDYSWVFIIRWQWYYYDIAWMSLIMKNSRLFDEYRVHDFKIVRKFLLRVCIYHHIICSQFWQFYFRILIVLFSSKDFIIDAEGYWLMSGIIVDVERYCWCRIWLTSNAVVDTEGWCWLRGLLLALEDAGGYCWRRILLRTLGIVVDVYNFCWWCQQLLDYSELSSDNGFRQWNRQCPRHFIV